MPEPTAETLALFERAVADLLDAFDVERPPVPLELMLQRPRPSMWREVNLSELSLSFISIDQPFSPRMSIARLLARHMCRCAWGAERGLAPYAENDEALRALARAVVMPRSMLEELPAVQRTTLNLSARFEMPEKDVILRLSELGLAS
ncbi:MAG: hypothetical protein CUN49_09120 [Candidatus Thermofonsia Clade 1 bacterium]|jgi:hypothetical protein|uniref:IrrE N-terminal-like domain-containing protein n=1 Tax=Candidatus Thermofonsia Clade 1 bacterium TaxID=2364210 RepID=A0A2M8PZ32_9CHLR|nr:MAG: hypothetical protein CUN49_09120 [Candidatus Thermofonsia Clade 1 bacterium]PJF42798.1 MAG: hypothetical protein CUN50_02585 [Candidatus Thermofonsia Clade 1 bacterium]RMF48806.1 MAG: hypothetical protein D6749_14755 [Chloroflexota bacterium]